MRLALKATEAIICAYARDPATAAEAINELRWLCGRLEGVPDRYDGRPSAAAMIGAALGLTTPFTTIGCYHNDDIRLKQPWMSSAAFRTVQRADTGEYGKTLANAIASSIGRPFGDAINDAQQEALRNALGGPALREITETLHGHLAPALRKTLEQRFGKEMANLAWPSVWRIVTSYLCWMIAGDRTIAARYIPCFTAIPEAIPLGSHADDPNAWIVLVES